MGPLIKRVGISKSVVAEQRLGLRSMDDETSYLPFELLKNWLHSTS